MGQCLYVISKNVETRLGDDVKAVIIIVIGMFILSVKSDDWLPTFP